MSQPESVADAVSASKPDESGEFAGSAGSVDFAEQQGLPDDQAASDGGNFESFAASVDAEIYEIFVEEVNEILDNFRVWIPQWAKERGNTELLREIRRAYHTCKGSGRMVGGMALGDYAWAHEDMLNKVLEGALPRNDNLAAILQQSSRYLDGHRDFFLNAEQIDEAGRGEIAKVEAFVNNPEAANDLTAVTAALNSEVHPEPESLIADSESEELVFDLVSKEPVIDPEPEALVFTPIAEEPVIEPEPENLVFTPIAEEPIVDELPGISPETPAPADTAFLPEVNEFDTVDDQEEQRIVWAMFKEELPDQLLSIDQQMQNLLANHGDEEAVRELERELHTLKGSSRMAQLMDMGDAAHQAEELLETVRRERGRVISDSELDELQKYLDQISLLAEQHSLSGMPVAVMEEVMHPEAEAAAEGVMADIAPDSSPVQIKSSQPGESAYESYLEQILAEQSEALPDLSVLENIDAFTAEHAATQETATASPVPLSPADQEQIRLSAAYLDQMVNGSNALNIQQNTLRERLVLMGEDVGELGRTTARLRQLLRSLELETETQIHAGYRQRGDGRVHDSNFDPLEMDEYSEIQRLSRALAESLNDLVNIEGDLSSQLRTVEQFAHESQQTSRELHQSLLSTRLVEVTVIVPRLRRIMRQVASEFGRVISFEVDGESLKLDRYLLQRITAPIEHILRNAVFHGIEPPEEREALGKSRDGGILLEVRREDTEIVVSISDDGRGLNKDKILGKASALGLIKANVPSSDQDIYKLILHSGFTTVAEANQVAGRGVGMDVVNSEIKALGGSLMIDSVPGSGCEFTMRLPFTMVANPVLFVEVQKQQYALPLSGIQGLTRLHTEEVRQHLEQSDSPLLLGEQSYALHYLGTALEHQGQPELRDGEMHVVVYMRIGEQHIAWLVDAINGRRDVVLQSLGALFKTCHFYSAATITSDGKVVMVPDMLELTARMLLRQSLDDNTEHAAGQANAALTGHVVEHEHPHILIVDDSITVRKVTEKLLVNRNFVVETAKDGLEALEKLGAFEADLMLLDIEMPRMDGFEVLSAVRMEPRWQRLPVIMISSRTAEKHLEHAKALGATDFLGKPYQNQELLWHIDKHLQAAHVQGVGNTQDNGELAL
ncbi:MAG: Hpt domain-containing protein [Thiolinea sp.]